MGLISLGLGLTGKNEPRSQQKEFLSFELTNAVMDKISNIQVRTHDDSSGVTRENILRLYREDPDERCFQAFAKYNKNLFSGDPAKMILASSNEIGDLGSYEKCKSIPNAAYYILQLNITNLPIELRLGLCLPEYCTQEMLNRAGGHVSNKIRDVIKLASGFQDLDDLIKHNVTLETHFYHPDSRNERVAESRTVVAPIALTVLLVFFLLTFLGSLMSMQLAKKRENELKQKQEALHQRFEEYEN